MLILMIEKTWGFDRGKGKMKEKISGFKLVQCRLGELPQIGKNDFYRFAVKKIAKDGARLEMITPRRSGRPIRHNKIYAVRFHKAHYRPVSFDGGYKYDFILI